MSRLPQQATLETRVKELERQLRNLTTTNRLRSSSVGEGGLRFYDGGSAVFENGGGVDIRDGGNLSVDGSAYVGGTLQSRDFDGDLAAGNVGTTGWAFDRARAALPELLLRPGSITNDALANPVRGDVTLGSAIGFGLSTNLTTLASQTWQAPAGFTRVAVFVLVKVFAYNPTAGLDYLYARSRIVRVSDGHEITGMATPTAVSGGNGSGTSIAPGVAVLALQPGDSVRVEVQGSTAFAAWATNAGNGAEVTGSLTWYR